jgi:DNA phosphorothioation-dependent restriction protein DptG
MLEIDHLRPSHVAPVYRNAINSRNGSFEQLRRRCSAIKIIIFEHNILLAVAAVRSEFKNQLTIQVLFNEFKQTHETVSKPAVSC